MKPNWTAEQTSRNVHTVRLNVSKGFEAYFLLRSDAHHDNPHCDRELEYKHLKQAVERGAGVLDGGDLFCAMNGKWDKRADKSALRPEHQSGDYLDALVRTTADDYAPYAHHWISMGVGNHETGVRRAHETDLTERLVERLNAKTGAKVQAGGYGGFVRFLFSRGSSRQSRLLHYYHGSGGGGPVTRGVIQTNRMAVNVPDADIVHSGHTHDSWIVSVGRQRINHDGVLYRDEQIHVRTPGYKDAYGDGYAGFEVERMHNPKVLGSAWVKFTYDFTADRVITEVTRAQ